MSYYPDLTPHTYTKRIVEQNVLNIGWLGPESPFPTGEASSEFVAALEVLCSQPIMLHRGFHTCDFCGDEKGNGQIRVQHSSGLWYSAPTMIHHYVVRHHYLPPAEFIDAVLDPKQVL